MSLTQHEAERLITVIRQFVATPAPEKGKLARVMEGNGKAAKGSAPAPTEEPPRFDVGDMETLYQAFKNRFIEDAKIDPVLLHLITSRPEMLIEVERRVVEIDGSKLKGRVARLMAAGYFENARTTGAIRNELARTGPDPGGGGQLSECLKGLTVEGFLTSESAGWKIAPGVKITERELSKGK